MLVMFVLVPMESVGRNERMNERITERIRSVHFGSSSNMVHYSGKRHIIVRNLEICLQSVCVF